MHVKFKITYADGTFMESHDSNYNWVFDHAHALPPHNHKLWQRYDLISDDFGHMVGVDFNTGIFMFKGSTEIHPADELGESITFVNQKQNFSADDNWSFLNNLSYFPIVGRRVYKADWGEATIYFCGFKIFYRGKKIEKAAYVYPNGAISFT